MSGKPAASKAPGIMRLPPLKKLRVRRPSVTAQNPCIAIMSSVLSCWASAGFNVAGCAALETSLRACMDEKKKTQIKKSTVNYHLSRFHDKMGNVNNKKK